jgi:hypothetical protein
VQPMLTTPGHGSFPSGHSTQAFMLARLLDGILNLQLNAPSMAEQLYRQASRIATNRVVAGLHFPADGIAGRMLGHTIAEYILARLNVSPDVIHRSFEPPDALGSSLDLDLVAQDVNTVGTSSGIGDKIIAVEKVGADVGTSSVLWKLFTNGVDERAALLLQA